MPAQASRPHPVDAGFTTRAVDPTVNSLPPGYRGQSLDSVIAKLEERHKAREKDEYETEAEFKARIAALPEKPLVGRLTLADSFAFSFAKGEPGSKPNLEAQYDADAEVFRLRLGTDGVREKDGSVVADDFFLGVCSESWHEGESYTGVNGFGAKATIRPVMLLRRCLRFPRKMLLDDARGHLEPETLDLTFRVAVPRAEARATSGDFRVLFLGKIVSEAVLSRYDGAKPTIQSPLDLTEATEYVKFLPEQVWVYNGRTGRIYYRSTVSMAR